MPSRDGGRVDQRAGGTSIEGGIVTGAIAAGQEDDAGGADGAERVARGASVLVGVVAGVAAGGETLEVAHGGVLIGLGLGQGEGAGDVEEDEEEAAGGCGGGVHIDWVCDLLGGGGGGDDKWIRNEIMNNC